LSDFYRAHFVCEDDPASNLSVDMLLDERRYWISHVMSAGWWGRLNSNDLWPFVLQKSGKIDFGNTEDEPFDPKERFGWIELEGRLIAKGEHYTFQYNGRTVDFILERLSRIPDLAPD
jgi:hypothetical protein